ncbi:hypothetical protein HDU82_003679 [Entophlyctis luteolus]|nr:hypothetical protein HDU82_003679 [Entophlyctis luteolus]
MHCIAHFALVPVGTGSASYAKEVAQCQRVLDAARLTYSTQPCGTIIEGDWDAVMDAVRMCHRTVHDMGCPRISTTITFDTRTDKPQSLDQKHLKA